MTIPSSSAFFSLSANNIHAPNDSFGDTDRAANERNNFARILSRATSNNKSLVSPENNMNLSGQLAINPVRSFGSQGIFGGMSAFNHEIEDGQLQAQLRSPNKGDNIVIESASLPTIVDADTNPIQQLKSRNSIPSKNFATVNNLTPSYNRGANMSPQRIITPPQQKMLAISPQAAPSRHMLKVEISRLLNLERQTQALDVKVQETPQGLVIQISGVEFSKAEKIEIQKRIEEWRAKNKISANISEVSFSDFFLKPRSN